jgi:hypothetical protein
MKDALRQPDGEMVEGQDDFTAREDSVEIEIYAASGGVRLGQRRAEAAGRSVRCLVGRTGSHRVGEADEVRPLFNLVDERKILHLPCSARGGYLSKGVFRCG